MPLHFKAVAAVMPLLKTAPLVALLVSATAAQADGPSWSHTPTPVTEEQSSEVPTPQQPIILTLFSADTCGAEPYLSMGGQTRDVIEATLGLQGRVFTPDRMAGTTDYIPRRLNLTFDEQDRLVGVGCG